MNFSLKLIVGSPIETAGPDLPSFMIGDGPAVKTLAARGCDLLLFAVDRSECWHAAGGVVALCLG